MLNNSKISIDSGSFSSLDCQSDKNDKYKSHKLYRLFYPRSIAVVGASKNINYGAGSFIYGFNKFKYSEIGNIYPVNPKYADQKLHGHTCYASLKDLPESPDYIFCGLPAAKAPDLLQQAIEVNAKFMMLFTSGFGELGTATGRALHDEVISILNSDDNKNGKGEKRLRIIGPNCLGVYNPAGRMTIFHDQINRTDGTVGVISQSGGQIGSLIDYLSYRNIFVNKGISMGNMLDVHISEILDFYGENPAIKAIVCYMEGLPENTGRSTFEVIKKVTKKKPVIIWKAGRIKESLAAVSSHTGALAGNNRIFLSAMEQAGAVTADSLESAFDAVSSLSLYSDLIDKKVSEIQSNDPAKIDENYPVPLNFEFKTAIAVTGGGFSVTIIDTFGHNGIKKADFNSLTTKKLAEILPGINTFIVNPIDMGDKGMFPDIFKRTLELCMADENVNILVTAFEVEKYAVFKEWINDPDLEKKHARIIKEVSLKYNKPIIIIVPETNISKESHALRLEFKKMLRDINIPCFPTIKRAAAATLALQLQIRNRLIKGESAPLPHQAILEPKSMLEAKTIIDKAGEEKFESISEYNAKKVLAYYGIPVAGEKLIKSEKDLIPAVSDIGYPLVMKACSPEIQHKTEQGLVITDIRNEMEAKAACKKLISATKDEKCEILVQKMVKGKRELVMGLINDNQFGPSIMMGIGGIFTEVFNDVTFRMAPLDKKTAFEMLDDFKASNILNGVRGLKPADKNELAEMLIALGRIGMENKSIAAIDINPVIISDGRPVAVDALIQINQIT